ncbi:MAG TPA: hypothetical protein VLL76_01710 [Candidatus Omnitrophota bacterium]|nr:hypothetical protein [Candidatus Omnitrophota bacterium]
MSLFGRRARGADVAPGDIFRKAGTYGGEWVVERVFEYPDIPRHVRLVERQGARAMTVAATMLFDTECFTPVSQGMAEPA